MNNKGFTLGLVGTVGHRSSISLYQIVLLIVGAVLLITIATFVLSSLPFSSSNPSISAVGNEADSARWIAVGERYRAKELNSEKAAAAIIARWNALGQRYQTKALVAEQAAAANSARWIALGERYSKIGPDTAHVVDPGVARWIAQGERYLAGKLEAERIEKAYNARWNGLGARFQAMGQ